VVVSDLISWVFLLPHPSHTIHASHRTAPPQIRLHTNA
jgi:hypothetical protein